MSEMQAAHQENLSRALALYDVAVSLHVSPAALLLPDTDAPDVSLASFIAVENLMAALKRVADDAEARSATRTDLAAWLYASDTHATLWDGLVRARCVLAGERDLSRYDPLLLPLEATRRALKVAGHALEVTP